MPESCSAYSPYGQRCGEFCPTGRALGAASVATRLPKPEWYSSASRASSSPRGLPARELRLTHRRAVYAELVHNEKRLRRLRLDHSRMAAELGALRQKRAGALNGR